MTARIFTIVLLFTFSIRSIAQQTDTAFQKEWKAIDTAIIKDDLTKTALAKVNLVYKLAKQRQLPDQVIKALLYRYSLEERVVEENPLRVIESLKKEIAQTSDQVQKAVLYTLLAKQYKQYFDNHRWDYLRRAQTKNTVQTDITTWSVSDFSDSIKIAFTKALSYRDVLKQKKVSLYEAVIIKGNTRALRPTLFDLIAHEALEYFKPNDNYLPKGNNDFLISDPNTLQPADTFLASPFNTKDNKSAKWQALELFKQLISFHKNDADKNAMLSVDIERIEWVHEQAVFASKDALYKSSLQKITEQYPMLTETAYAWFLLAAVESNKAGSYEPFSDTSNRYGYVKALQIIEKGLSYFKGKTDQNRGFAEMKNLAAQIKRVELKSETEVVNIPGKPILASAVYRNTDTLFGRIIRIQHDDKVFSERRMIDWPSVTARKYMRSFAQALPRTNDYQQHIAAFKIDDLPPGYYALLSSNNARFLDSADKISVQYFHVSSISYIKSNNNIFVVNRETGEPIANVKAVFLRQTYNDGTKIVYDTTVKKSDRNGNIKLNNVRDGSMQYSFILPGDTLRPVSYDYIYNTSERNDTRENFEKRFRRLFFFTDRAIYRPGQTLFFKAIAATKDYDSKLSKLITNETATVYLKDANGKTVDSIKSSLNSYGSIAGKFNLPENGLTGQFRLESQNFNYSYAYFSVEEYKRPTFSATIEKPKGTYRLNDTITVTGTAKAFSGNVIDGANVSYRVTRNKRFLDPWFSRRPIGNLASVEVAHGEIKTNAEGKFTIKFPAFADDITDSSGNPLFEFNIKADVTDINGETRSASTGVSTGFKSLLLELAAPALVEKDSAQKININTTNFSREKEPAQVTLMIYKLPAPRLLRIRLLSKPDQFILSKDEFIKYFPTDEYQAESDLSTLPVGEMLFEETINTKDQNTVTIPANKLPVGNYKIIAVTKDKSGSEVKQSVYVTLFDKKDIAQFPKTNGMVYTENAVVEPGQQASFLTGIHPDRVFMISKTERPAAAKSKTDFEYNYINRGIHTINYTPDEKDRGGVTITELYVYNNRVYTTSYNVMVPWTNKMLNLSYESYRDKAEPGSQEKWTVSIKGNAGEQAAAELLTGMYDASLDQFKPHSWLKPEVWDNNFARTVFETTSNFRRAATAAENNVWPKQIEVPYAANDRLAGNAEELWSQGNLNFNMQTGGGRVAAPFMARDMSAASLSEMVLTDNKKMAVGNGMLGGNLTATGAAANIQIRGSGSISTATPLYVVDGKIVTDISDIPADMIVSIDMLNAAQAIALYGDKGANGVIVITTKKSAPQIVVRKNFNETAFFFPQLYADSSGKYSFSFTMPESLTQWKWMSLAHTKDLAFGVNNTSIVTQKKLMVQANAPRFMREGDNMEFSGKIVNMTEKEITGQVTLELVDPITNTSIDGWFQNVFPVQYFTVEAGQSFGVKFPILIPFSYNRPLTWRIKAVSGDMSDGEENTLPVLTNRMLVTETLPLFLPNDTTQHFSFDKLLNNKSESLTHEAITVEYSSNPVWYAVQALPYLMEYPYECAEQTFNRFYANALASYIVNKHPKIKQIFEQWKADSTAFKSNLQKNEELKQILLQETPWVLQAESEEQQRKNMALLFDLVKLSTQTESIIEKLKQMQLPNGAFSWFKGGYEDRYITNYILTGIGKLKRLGALSGDVSARIRTMLVNALKYTDTKIADDYNWLIKNKADLTKQQVSTTQIDYLYMRSFFRDIAVQSKKEYDYYFAQGKQFWIKQNSYYKAQLGLIYFRNSEEKFATQTILPALLENTVMDSKQGMYWKTTNTGFWYQSPIEHQSMMIAFMSELNVNQPDASLVKNINAMKTWLLLNKQTNNWRTTIATADACYALLLNGSDWLGQEKTVTIQLGKTTVSSTNEKTAAGTGYFKKRIDGKMVSLQMGDITVSVNSKNSQSTNSKINSTSPSWGNIYWQYFEDLDKITPSATPLSLVKKLFIQRNTDKGVVLDPIKENQELKTGDKVIVRIELRSDRDMDYLHLKDMRAAAMEPVNVLSGYKWQDGLGYYESTKDASTNFFIDHLRKGTYVFDYPLFITHTGIFSVGIASIQCMYAPEFTSHSDGIKIRVAK